MSVIRLIMGPHTEILTLRLKGYYGTAGCKQQAVEEDKEFAHPNDLVENNDFGTNTSFLGGSTTSEFSPLGSGSKSLVAGRSLAESMCKARRLASAMTVFDLKLLSDPYYMPVQIAIRSTAKSEQSSQSQNHNASEMTTPMYFSKELQNIYVIHKYSKMKRTSRKVTCQ